MKFKTIVKHVFVIIRTKRKWYWNKEIIKNWRKFFCWSKSKCCLTSCWDYSRKIWGISEYFTFFKRNWRHLTIHVYFAIFGCSLKHDKILFIEYWKSFEFTESLKLNQSYFELTWSNINLNQHEEVFLNLSYSPFGRCRITGWPLWICGTHFYLQLNHKLQLPSRWRTIRPGNNFSRSRKLCSNLLL